MNVWICGATGRRFESCQAYHSLLIAYIKETMYAPPARKASWIGDPWLHPSFLDDILGAFAVAFAEHVHAMPGTAIAIVYCSEGFAIAADGREMRDGKKHSDEQQKIFSFVDEHRLVAYGLTGHSSLINDQTGAVVDLEAEVRQAFVVASSEGQASVNGFIDRVRYRVYGRLNASKTSGVIDRFPEDKRDPGTIALVPIAGYYEGEPFAATVWFAHDNQILEKPRLPCPMIPAVPGYTHYFFGSRKVEVALLKSKASPLQAYWCPAFEKIDRNEDIPLAEAVLAVTNFVQACCDSRTVELKIDENCRIVGGHIHVATITKSDGFKWMIGPKG